MIGKTNASLGGGGGEVFALIQQPYPVGSPRGILYLPHRTQAALPFTVTRIGCI